MRWTEDISVGVPIIDNGHRELMNRLNNLRSAIKKQVCRYTIEDAIAFLVEYSETHFCAEEQYMLQYRYPRQTLHKEQHDKFREDIYFLKEELHNIRTLGLKGSYELSVEVVQVVADWVHAHVMVFDGELLEFLRQFDISVDVTSSLCGDREHFSGGLITICSICHKIRSEKGIWKQKEYYGEIPSDIVYSHGLCPECLQNYYADLFEEKR